MNFSKSTGLVINPSKCKVYFGAVESCIKEEIKHITAFQEGSLPFRYLGVPLTGKKLSVNHYMSLIDKIVARITHWSAKLLSYAGRLQLIRSTTYAITNYWMTCFPFPKKVIQKINVICRSFLWTGGTTISRKSPISWKQVCTPKNQGGLNLINLEIWNAVTMMKLLWNVCSKKDSLWIKWINCYYMKNGDVMSMGIKDSCSWILKGILKQRQKIQSLTSWSTLLQKDRFVSKIMYNELQDVSSRVPWRKLFFSNLARPRAKFVFWTACHGRLATKVRMMKFGLLSDTKCNFCDHLETIDHLLFECAEMKDVWIQILEWQKINHQPKKWIEELSWAMAQGKGKGHRATLLKTALTETVYELWKYRNEVSFGGIVNNTHIGKKIMDSIVYRSWTHKKMREYIARLLIS